MAINEAAISAVSLDDILFNDVQEFLKNEAVMMSKITDYTNRPRKNAASFDVPRLSGVTVADRKDDGTEHISGGMGFSADNVPFDQHKIAADFIYDLAREKTELDLTAAFLEVAPSALGDVMEQAIYAELKLASAAAPDHIQQLTGVGNLVPTINDITSAAQILNAAKVGMERYLIVDSVGYKALIDLAEIRDYGQSGSTDGLVKGQFSEIGGFKLLWSNNATAGEMLCWTPSALAFGMQKTVTFEQERQASYERDYVALKASYGRKVLDSGKRVVLFNATGA